MLCFETGFLPAGYSSMLGLASSTTQRTQATMLGQVSSTATYVSRSPRSEVVRIYALRAITTPNPSLNPDASAAALTRRPLGAG
jgi:hypothetical protein